MLARTRGHQLAETRKQLRLGQKEIAAVMGVSVARISQIEHGEVSSFEVIARYIEALGGVWTSSPTSATRPSASPSPAPQTPPPDDPASMPSDPADEMPLDSAGQDQLPLRSTAVGVNALTCTAASALCQAAEPRENHDRRPAKNAHETAFSQLRARAGLRPEPASGAVCVGSNPTGGATESAVRGDFSKTGRLGRANCILGFPRKSICL